MSKTILVGMSGGVDSSVCALLLKKQGYNVIGARMTIWGDRQMQETVDKMKTSNACFSPNEKERIEEAQKIASELGIEFYSVDCTKEYEKIVLDNFRQEYLKGRTPNPCVMCNPLVKFKALPELAKKMGIEFDYFATGHYAKIEKRGERFVIKRGIMPKKDQSYFLYKLSQEQLSKILLPLGNYTKEEIRTLAREFGLEVANKPDSQDFYDGDYNDLLKIEEKIGNIVDTSGKILGQHKGIWNYTVGQRKGLKISASEPLYVISLNKEKNEVVVGNIDETFNKALYATDINFVGIEDITEPIKVRAKFRSTQQPTEATLEKIDDDTIKVTFDEYQKSIAMGQSVVCYDEDDVVLVGGIIDKVE